MTGAFNPGSYAERGMVKFCSNFCILNLTYVKFEYLFVIILCVVYFFTFLFVKLLLTKICFEPRISHGFIKKVENLTSCFTILCVYTICYNIALNIIVTIVHYILVS